jgi:hypothetical protein
MGRDARRRAREEHAKRLAMAGNGEQYLAETLARTREALTQTLQRLAAAKDPKDRELLARACSHLAEMERRLSGRPMPGTRRPAEHAAPLPRATLPSPE